MKVKSDLDIKKVPEDYIFQSSSEVGETPREFVHPYDNKYIAKVNDRSIRNEQARIRDEALLESLLNALGVKTNNSYSNMYLLVQTLLNAKILLDSDEYVAVESVNGYIKNISTINDVFKKSYIEQFKNILDDCHQVVDNQIVQDETKLSEMEEI